MDRDAPTPTCAQVDTFFQQRALVITCSAANVLGIFPQIHRYHYYYFIEVFKIYLVIILVAVQVSLLGSI